MAAMPIATPAPFGGPVVVVGQQFCAPRGVDLTVTKKAFSLTGSDFAVTDVDGNVVLKVKGVYFSLRDRCVLVDAAGNPLLTLQLKCFGKQSGGDDTYCDGLSDLEYAPKMASVQRREHRVERPAVQRQEVQSAAI
ncbi:hypothetical protein B296_00046997 [Ensete ventricosum]|uniref:Uncharacterized protein n=1 Tax=Ensete ventricosum TaxID=4639 RepID=A0A426Z1H0_ENSVE|nr:hypothetical protein B296_00046997 [Ensete ventricosum]